MDPIFYMDKGGLPLELKLSFHFRRGVFFNDGQMKAQCSLCTPIDKSSSHLPLWAKQLIR